MAKGVLLVVGTTKFDALVKSATEKRFQELLVSKGYSKLKIQLGHGEHIPSLNNDTGLDLEWYKFKPSLADDMREASLIISHGGSGSILESLALRKPLVVVINESLMHNHQWELASQLAEDKHLAYTTCHSLYETVKELDPLSLNPYQSGNPKIFTDHLDVLMGFVKTS